MRWALVLIVAVTGDAAAESIPDQAKRLFEEGRELKNNNDPQACERFAQSYALVAAPGTAFNLAQCMEAQGKYVLAVQLFDAAASVWEREPDRTKSFTVARERADALRLKLVKVVVTLDDPTQAGLTLTIGERRVPPAREISDVFDPGEIQITAMAPAARPFARTVRAASGERVAVHIASLPPIGEPKPEDEHLRPGYKAAMTSLIVVGGVSLIASGYFFYDARRLQSAGDHDRALSQADLATAFGVAGLALGITAGIVYVKAPRMPVRPTANGVAFVF